MNIHTTVGIIGCGTISSTYLKAPQLFSNVRIAACADIDMSRARAQAAKFGVPRACSVAELLADPQIELVVNLNVPPTHPTTSHPALPANKSSTPPTPLAT